MKFAEVEEGMAIRTLLLVCGNTLRGDDGVAWRIAETLVRRPLAEEVEVIFTQQLLPEHAEAVSHAGLVLFIDCSALSEPGEVEMKAVPLQDSLPRIFTHHLDPPCLLRLTHELYGSNPRRAAAITVGGLSFELSEELTEPVSAAIPLAVERIRAIIASQRFN